MSRIWNAFATMPSTNVRIAASIIAMLATTFVTLTTALIVAVRGAGTAWEPGYEWLGFLVLYAGLDVAQFHSKRVTQKPEPAPPEG